MNGKVERKEFQLKTISDLLNYLIAHTVVHVTMFEIILQVKFLNQQPFLPKV